jgi:LytS/YehU family sensor histidine kinase
VVAALGELGELLRATLDDATGQEVALDAEIAFVQRYLALQRMRFPDRLTFDVDVAREAGGARVPAFVLLPIVENAVQHGLERLDGGRVVLGARRDGDTLAIDVANDGVPPDGARRERIGLGNTRARLAQLYGAAQSLECAERPGGGAVVRIRIPWRTGTAVAGTVAAGPA